MDNTHKIEEIIRIQSEELKEWKIILAADVFEELEFWTIENNENALAKGDSSLIRHGADLKMYISNNIIKPVRDAYIYGNIELLQTKEDLLNYYHSKSDEFPMLLDSMTEVINSHLSSVKMQLSIDELISNYKQNQQLAI